MIALTSLQLLVDFGVEHDISYHALQKGLSKYIPADKINLNSSVYWIQKVMELYTGLKPTSKLESKLTYIEQIKFNPNWQGNLFFANVK